MSYLNKIQIVLFAILTSSIFGCQKHKEYIAVMNTAMNIMEEHPDSALSILSKVDNSLITDEAILAKYGVLYTMALDKNFVDDRDDDYILKAYNYFSNNTTDKYKMLSAYYMSKALYIAGDIEPAVFCGLEAIDMSGELNDTLWSARSNELIADIYNRTYAIDQAITHRKKAIDYYRLTGKSLNTLYSLGDLCEELYYTGEHERSRILIDSLIYVAKNKEVVDSTLLAYYLTVGIHVYSTSNFRRVSSMLNDKIACSNFYPMTSDDFIKASVAATRTDTKDSITYFLNIAKALPQDCEDSLHILLLDSYVSNLEGKYNVAYNLSDSLIGQLNKKMRSVLKQSAISAQNDYLTKSLKKTRLNAERERDRNIRLITTIIILLIVSVIIVIAVIKIKNKIIQTRINEISLATDQIDNIIFEKDDLLRQNSQYKQRVYELEQSYGQLNQEKRTTDVSIEQERLKALQLKESMKSLFLEHTKTINTLCVQFFDGDNAASKSAIYNQVKKELSEIRDEEKLKIIIDYVNYENDDILNKIKNTLPELKDEDITLIAMVVAGFNTRIISVVTGLSPQGVYSKRRRVLSKLNESENLKPLPPSLTSIRKQT